MDLLRYERDTHFAVLTLHRPDQRNALSRDLIAALSEAIRRATDEPTVRVIILTGAGSAFCAGMDLAELRSTIGPDTPKERIWTDAHALSRLFDQIYSCPKPTIAAVNGPAVAGGAGIVSVCDLAVAAKHARFGYPEVRLGLVAAMVLPHLLRHVGERAARQLLLTGSLIDADEALRIGLINRVTEADDLMPTVRSLALDCVRGGPAALATTKALLRQCSHQAVSVGQLADASAEPRLTEECQHGLTAFFEKKLTPWSPD